MKLIRIEGHYDKQDKYSTSSENTSVRTIVTTQWIQPITQDSLLKKPKDHGLDSRKLQKKLELKGDRVER